MKYNCPITSDFFSFNCNLCYSAYCIASGRFTRKSMEFKCFKIYRALIKWISFMKSDYQCFDANTIKSGGFFSGLREGYVQTKNDVFQGQ